jgi:tripartite ATP-independent transporter DctM subunit
VTPEVVGLLGLVGLVVLIALRVHVGIAMLAVAIAGNAYITSTDAALARLGIDAYSSASNYGLSVIPLFVFMGLVLAQAQLGKDLYALLDVLLRRVRGGLGVATIGAAAMFGSVSGSAVASASTMSAVATPEMQRYRYDAGLAAATTAVGGTLGALIPPSAVLVLYGILTEEPIGRILIGGIIPGIMTALILMATAWLVVWRRPSLAPDVQEDSPASRSNRVRHAARLAARVWAVPLIFGVSMGGIYLGVFTPTEAGAAGAALALLYGLVSRRLSWTGFTQATSQTVMITAVIFLVVVASQMYGFFLSVTRIPRNLGEFVEGLDVAPWVVIAMIFAIYFALGAIMDEIAILVIMTPMMYPIVIGLGYDGTWFGVVSIMMLLSGLLTPPVGLIVYVVSNISKVPVGTVFRAVTPFWMALIVAVALAVAFPDIVLWLPGLMR